MRMYRYETIQYLPKITLFIVELFAKLKHLVVFFNY